MTAAPVLTPLVVSAEPLLRAIAANPDAGHIKLAELSNRKRNNIARDLDTLANNNLITRHPPALLPAGLAALAAIDRANGAAGEAANAVPNPADVQLGPALRRWDQLFPSELNPRRTFDPDKLTELADGIDAAGGVIQAILVRPTQAMANISAPVHPIVAGERRWRAVRQLVQAGRWPKDRLIPVLIQQMDDATHRELALIENVQRADLTPLEEAGAFKSLADGGMTAEQIAAKIGKTRRFVEQRIDLNKLDDTDKERLAKGVIGIEEARQRANQPKPEPLTFTDAELLVMAELIHKWEHTPKRRGSYDVETEIAPGVSDPVLDRLLSLRGWVGVNVAMFDTERTYLRRGYQWPNETTLKIEPIPSATVIYRTPWLNGPFAIPAEGQKRLKDKAERGQAARAANKRAKEKAAKLAAEVADLETRMAAWSSVDQARFRQLMKAADSGHPWTLSERGAIKVDGHGYGGTHLNFYQVDPSFVRLLVMAINLAGGVGEPAGAARTRNGPLADMLGDTLSQQIRESAGDGEDDGTGAPE